MLSSRFHNFYPGTVANSVLSKCNRCFTTFDYIPTELNSTRGSYPEYNAYPKCPQCGSYRDTSLIERDPKEVL